MEPLEDIAVSPVLPAVPGRAMGSASGAWETFATAVRFLTRIPLGSSSSVLDARTLQCCPMYFPLVGMLIGLSTGAVLWTAALFFPVWLAVIFALAGEALLTGALHEDALADFCDAFGGGWTREDILRILKDSRVGTYGALALVLAVSLRAGAMFLIVERGGLENWTAWMTVFVTAAAIGRWTMYAVMCWLPPVENRGSLAQEMARQPRRTLVISTLSLIPAVAALIWFFPLKAFVALFLVSGTIVLFSRHVQRRLGGSTGDCVGCIGYITQLLVLLVMAAERMN